jgi:uncharacterized protein
MTKPRSPNRAGASRKGAVAPAQSCSEDPKPPERLLELQRQFAGHIRDPEGVAAPGELEERRLAIYRRLFFGTLDNLFSKNFPVLRDIIDDDRWRRLIREFMVEHRATTPMFTEIGREFVRFLDEKRPAGLPPFTLELAHWEYLETCVRLAEADPGTVPADRNGDLLAGVPVLNPTLRLAQYHWPVHEIGPDHQPDSPLDQAIVLAAWRRRDDKPGFMRLNQVTARLITLVDESSDASGRAILERIAQELKAPDPAAVVQSGADMLGRLHDREILLGTHPV